MKITPTEIFGFVVLAGQLAKQPAGSIEVSECPQRNPQEVKIAVKISPEALQLIWKDLPKKLKPVILQKLPFLSELLPAADAAGEAPGEG